jgi:hypothetical protein
LKVLWSEYFRITKSELMWPPGHFYNVARETMEWFTRPSKATLYSIENATRVQGILREDHGIETVLKPIRRWRRP